MIQTEMKIQHLLRLLDDNSPQIQEILRENILANSLEIIHKRPFYQLQTETEARPILDNLLQDLHFDLVTAAFRQLFHSSLEDIDLEKSVLLISYWNNAEIDIPVIVHQLDSMAEEIGSQLPISGHPLAFIDHINLFIFEKYGFRANTTDYYNPDNSFLDRVLETKKGIPITLSLLYMFISRRLQIPLAGVPLPAHFILKFDDGTDEIFFDPFYRGKIYSREECLSYLGKANTANPSEILSGCPDYQILLRMMRNIHLVYSSYKDEPQRITEIDKLLKLVEEYYQ